MTKELTHVLIVYCILSITWLCIRWSKDRFKNEMIKIVLFFIFLIGLLIELKLFNII